MSQQPLVTAIIATYNRAHIVGEAIESILHQTYRNIDLVVVDDGSKDDTAHKLEEYGERIRVIRQKNAGPAAAWNRGIEAARGEIITFLGSDDIWLPTFVERQVAVLEKAGESVPCSLANGWLRFATGKGITSFEYAMLGAECEQGIWTNVPEVLATRFVAFGQMIAIRRKAFERIGLFDENLRYLEDYDLAIRLSLDGPWGFVREPLVVWRQGTVGSLSQEGARERMNLIRILIKIRERTLASLEGKDQFATTRSLLKRILNHNYLELRSVCWSNEQNWFYRTAGKGLNLSVRGRDVYYRRTQRYPRMKFGLLEPAHPKTCV